MANSRKLPSSDVEALFERFATQAGAHLPEHCRVCVGYSGGLDSTVLLHLFSRLRSLRSLQLQAFHFHHGISKQADAWLAHCAATCTNLNIPFSAVRGDMKLPAGEGLEARARAARYGAFAQLDTDLIALAHHRDDQAETLLYRLLRGTGVHGAAGMPQARALGAALVSGSTLWRPLLDEPRSALLAYAKLHGLRWVEDESNDSVAYDRNFLRHEVLPVLRSRFPAADVTLARAADRFDEAAGLLDVLAAQDAGLLPGRKRNCSPP